jgi:hypothetical protein
VVLSPREEGLSIEQKLSNCLSLSKSSFLGSQCNFGTSMGEFVHLLGVSFVMSWLDSLTLSHTTEFVLGLTCQRSLFILELGGEALH